MLFSFRGGTKIEAGCNWDCGGRGGTNRVANCEGFFDLFSEL